MYLVGNVEGKIAVIFDDIADTCGTLLEASLMLKRKGARAVIAVVTHSILSGNAVENLIKSHIYCLITTNTMPIARVTSKYSTQKFFPKIIQVDVSGIIGNLIKELHSE